MDAAPLLLRLFAVLVAARIAAEVAERFRQPAVLAEIAAGIIIGPSLLGLVHHDEALSLLAELGAILLLFEVGLHMDLADLRSVGGDSIRVGVIGVAVPMGGALAVVRVVGVDGSAGLFLAAALTATSVGITARVFADMRALTTPEARTVLGAAVADDVIGLLILTIVLRVSTGGGLDAAGAAGVLGAALAFVVVGTAVAHWIVPRGLAAVAERARADGTLLVAGVALALGLAGVASWAKLAPIVGAFVAGVAVGSSSAADDLQRRLAPLGHLLIPIFFLSMGVDTQLGAFTDSKAMAIAGVLLVVGFAGKIVAGLGMKRGSGDRLLVGIGMIPRGEVGLIFAALGLSGGILDAQQHAALILVVLATTVATPPLLRERTRRIRRAATAAISPIEPPGGWLEITAETVELSTMLGAEPPTEEAARIGLDAAIACATRRPGGRLLSWLSALPDESVIWDEDLRRRLVALLLAGSGRSWRFLELSGLIAILLPEIDAALRRRIRDPFDLDPVGAIVWQELSDLTALIRAGKDPAVEVWERMDRRDLVVLGALARGAFDGRGSPEAVSRFAKGIGLPSADAETAAMLTAERHILPAAATRLDLGAEEDVLEIASHIGTKERADGLYVLATASASDPTQREAIRELWKLVSDVLSDPELVDASASDLLELRRDEVGRALEPVLPRDEVRAHLADAPRRYLLSQDVAAIARHVRMTETRPVRGEVRLEAEPDGEPGRWILHLAFVDRRAALADVAGAISAKGISIDEAVVSTWRSGIAVDVFQVSAGPRTDWDELRSAVTAALDGESETPVEPVDATVAFDDRASPWHTIVELRAPDRRGLLARVAASLARAGAQIHQATAATRDGEAVDTFFVTGRRGGKLDPAEQRSVRAALAGKPVRRFRPRFAVRDAGRLVAGSRRD
ncbi:MAG: cation:proton antiporter [Actinomycetota bacterium]